VGGMFWLHSEIRGCLPSANKEETLLSLLFSFNTWFSEVSQTCSSCTDQQGATPPSACTDVYGKARIPFRVKWTAKRRMLSGRGYLVATRSPSSARPTRWRRPVATYLVAGHKQTGGVVFERTNNSKVD